MAVIDSKKLLPSGNPGGSIAESQKPFLVPVSNIIYKKDVNISQKLLKPADRETQEPGGSLVVVKKKVLKIKDIINSTYLIQQSENNRKRKEKQRQKAEDREKKLETKPGGKVDSNNLSKVSLPGTSILDTIKRFVIFTFVGFLFDKYNQYLPKLLEFGKYIAPVTKFIDAFAKNAIDGVIKFIDFGYQTYDNVRKKIDDIGGKDAVKTFDEFSKNLNLILNGAIAASMLIASTSPGKPGRPGAPGKIPGGKPSTLPKNVKLSSYLERDPQTKLIERRYGNDAARMYEARKAQGASASRAHADVLKRFEKFGEPQRGLAGGTGTGGVFSRGLVKSANRTALKVLGKSGTRIAKGVFGRIPIVGGLIDFAFSLAMGENPGRAAAKAVGSTIGAALGTFIPVPFAGTILGGILGDIVGGAMYDTLVGSNQKPQAKAQGGQVRSRQSGVAPTRRIKTQQAPRPKTYTAPKTQPGRDIGGKLKIEELYGKDEPGKRSALRALTRSSSDLKKMNSMHGVTGGMLGAGIDMALGQKPDKKLANSLGSMFGSVVAAAVNAELDSSFNDISKAIAMAGGGVVPSREIKGGMSIGEKIGKYISNAFAIALESSAAKVLRNLNQELNLEGGPAGSPDIGGSMGPIEYGPLPLNMTQKQAFATIYELAKKHNAAMPELVAAMAMNESGYLSSLLARQYNNPFGQTGVGTKGSTRIPGNSRTFAVYNSLSDAVKFHVEKWNNDSSYGKGAGTYANAVEGLKAILPTYDPGGNHPQYVKNVASILSTMGFNPQNKNPLVDLSNQRLVQQRRPTSGGVIPGQQPQSVSGNLKDTGLKDSSGRSIKLKGIIADAFIDMAAAARKDGYDLGSGISSSYRSLEDQKRVYQQKYGNDWQKYMVWNSGHMSGEAFDINWNSAAGIWIRNNASRFGFQYNTYSGESTHFDWVGGYTPQSIIRQRRQQAALQPPTSTPSPTQLGRVIRSVNVDGTTYTEREGGKYYQNGKPITKALFDAVKKNHPSAFGSQASLAPSQQSREIASIQQNPSYSQGGSMIIHDVNNIVMPVMVG